jgi:hypothetical protein
MQVPLSIVACVLLASVAACGETRAGGASAHGGGIVDWVDRPAPSYTPPAPTPLPYPTTAPICRVEQLRATGAVVGAAAGNVDERFTFTNVSDATCLLRGFPTISGLAPDGRRVRLDPTRSPNGTFFGTEEPSDMPPDHHVYLDLGTEDVTCSLSHPIVYHELTFGLPDGSSLTSHARLPRLCGGWEMNRFGLPPRTTATIPPRPGSPDTLRVTISPQLETRADATLRYVVTLANRTKVAVRLVPCPSYTETMYVVYTVINGKHRWWPGQPRIRPSFFLNCDEVRVIAPGRRVHFSMRLQVPPMPPGLAKFAWLLNTPAQPATSTMLTITRGS